MRIAAKTKKALILQQEVNLSRPFQPIDFFLPSFYYRIANLNLQCGNAHTSSAQWQAQFESGHCV